MPLSMSKASLPVFVQMLEALIGVLEKAEAFAAAKKLDAGVLPNARLAPDMFPLTRQVQIACDFAKGAAARLAGVEVPTYEDKEATLADLKARVRKTLDFIATVKPAQVDGSETRKISIKTRDRVLEFDGETYLTRFALPHLYFHLTTTYAILRHNGVDIGKRDYIGKVPGL